jgi:hypothetical protein
MTSGVFSFTTRDIPPILLVDDDDNSPDVRSYYTDALDGLGQFYDVWDTNNSDNEPSAFDLAPYEFVVWFTGDSFGGAAGPGAAGEAALGEWLDGGGCFLISSQDYLYDRGLTGFMQDYLGVSSFTNDVSQTSVNRGRIGLRRAGAVHPVLSILELQRPDLAGTPRPSWPSPAMQAMRRSTKTVGPTRAPSGASRSKHCRRQAGVKPCRLSWTGAA